MAVTEDCSKSHLILPYELQREIFETTGVLDRKNIASLILVARRVQFWVEPILYETVVLNGAGAGTKFLRTLRSKPRTFFTENVKNLCLGRGVTVPQAECILSVCTGINNLACWVTPESYAAPVLVPLISNSMHLRKLSLNHCRCLCTDSKGTGGPLAVAFGNITHLDLANPWAMWHSLDLGFKTFPRLTHLAFRFWTRDSVVPCIQRILEQCLSLRVLALLVHEHLMSTASKFLIDEGLDDPRIVLVRYSEDIEFWNEMKLGQPDLWTRAKSITAVTCRECEYSE